jgi:hypothetical protein
MTAAPHQPPRRPSLVNAEDLPDYPIDRDQGLEGHHFMRLAHNRWLNSTMYLLGDYEVQGVAMAMFCHAQNGRPIGTLPANEPELSALLRIPLAHWRALCARDIGPMHGWARCRCGDEVRLMHKVVLDVLQDTLRKVSERDLSKEDRAISARRDRLVKALIELGCSKEVIADPVLIGRIDMWLLESCKGNRTRLAYIRALEHAKRAGWLGGEG